MQKICANVSERMEVISRLVREEDAWRMMETSAESSASDDIVSVRRCLGSSTSSDNSLISSGFLFLSSMDFMIFGRQHNV